MTPAALMFRDSVGESEPRSLPLALAGSLSSALARPKSRTFTPPSGVILTLAGLRSRCTMPRSWAYSSARRDLSGDRQRLVDRQRAPRQPLREVLALDQLEREREDSVRLLEPVDRADPADG